jgi:hypothetical protein
LAPNHGQKSWKGVPLRSSSAMTLIPLSSTATRGVATSADAWDPASSRIDC